jgi:hypothetical protein
MIFAGCGDEGTASFALAVFPHQGLLCAPSQNGALVVFLHAHSQTDLVSSTLKALGSKSVPLWEPSQNGWFLLSPHEHQ